MKAKPPKFVYWKEVILSIATVYPLIIICDFFLHTLFPMEKTHPYFSIFCTVVLVSCLIVYPVMPFAIKKLGPWLQKKE